MRSFLVFIVLMVMSNCCVADGLEVSGSWQPVAVAAADVVEVPEVTDAKTEERQEGGRRLTWRQYRKLGLTVHDIRRAVEELQTADEFDWTDRRGTAAQVLGKLITDRPEAYGELAADIDWDKLLELIEKIIDLLLKILPLF